MTQFSNGAFQRSLLLLCLLFALVGAWYVALPDSLALLITDDYTWYASLMYMHDATQGHAPLSLLVPNPFYGLPFWLISFAAAWPFFSSGDAGVLIAPRVVEVLCGAASLAILTYALRAELVRRTPVGNPLWLLVAPLLVLAMPLWWQQAQLIHPQHMLILAEVFAVFLLVRDEGRLGRFYWAGVGAVGIALSLKFEAIMLAPMVLAYLMYAFHSGTASGKRFLSVFAGSAVLPLVILVALNPYLLTPHGVALWFHTNFAGVAYVATSKAHEHQQAVVGSLIALASMKAQIWALTKNLLNFPIILLLSVILLADAIASLRVRRFTASVWVAPYILICLLLCLFVVKNTQTYYWMTPTILLSFALVPAIARMPARVLPLAAALLLLAQFAFPGMLTAGLLRDRQKTFIYSAVLDRELPAAQVRAFAQDQARQLAPYLRASRRPLISAVTNLDYKEVGPRYIDQIYGCLTEETLSATEGRVPKPQVDLVILRHNDRILAAAECPDTAALVAHWKGVGTPFALVKDTGYLRAFVRRESP